MNDEIIKQLEYALTFLGQAQEKATPQSALWNEIGDKFEEVDTIITAIKEGVYEDA